MESPPSSSRDQFSTNISLVENLVDEEARQSISVSEETGHTPIFTPSRLKFNRTIRNRSI